MKLLRITAEGLPLFKDKLDLCFCASQRLDEESKGQLYHLFSNIYLNPITALVGVNASGKTSVLRLVLAVLSLLSCEPLNHLETRRIFGFDNGVKLNSYLFYERSGLLCRLETVIGCTGGSVPAQRCAIVSETLWCKKASGSMPRSSLFDFKNCSPVLVRNGSEAFLSDDVSVLISQNRKNGEALAFESMNSFTGAQNLTDCGDASEDVLALLDPSVESLKFEERSGGPVIRLKFKGRPEIAMNSAAELANYLSSGTIKGLDAFSKARRILKSGGCLVIDELENHFNLGIVAALMRFFTDSRINPRGAILIFSSHCPELLDEFSRGDCIYVTRNQGGIAAARLSDRLKRNDIKKSDAYASDYLGGTAPDYDAYMRLKRNLESIFDAG